MVIGSSVMRSATVDGGRLAQALLEVPQRLEEHHAAEQLDVVREVEVAPSSSAMTRSSSVTIPTQRPPSLTTGRPGSSCSRMRETTVSTPSSGVTVTGSASMMSRTARATGTGAYLRRASITSRAITAVRAALRGGAHARAGVQAHRRRRRRRTARRRAPARAPRTPLSTSPVPAVASAGLRARADRDAAAGPRDERVVALEHHDRLARRRRPRARGAGAGRRPRRCRRRAGARARRRAA